MIRRRVARVLALLALLLSSGCATDSSERRAVSFDSFAAYASDALRRVMAPRSGDGADVLRLAGLNVPREWRPAAQARGGVLLVHGLGDSPWAFHDLAPELARQGFLVRTVLLPGHGTVPEAMLEVRLEDWRRTVAEQADLLRRDAGLVYLGGFSTGANLVLDQAYSTKDVAGLLLFSPAFRSSVPFGWVTPMLRHVKPWLAETKSATESIPMRYSNVPTNGFAQFHRSSRLAQRHLASGSFDKPVLMVLAASDSVVDTDHAVKTFQTRFPHPASRLVWYGRPPQREGDDARILTQPDMLPAWRISQFSHMGVLFSPNNALYGREGTLRLCHNGHDAQATQACQQGGEIWFSEWGYSEPGKVHARLTFNPYFTWQAGVMAEVLEAGIVR
ncbi:alpha/beta hydrolase [Rubrivivax sp. RP6-9]|uniref:alpha/beta hydrolase n=1 Tax=Rubrivivax sp. RP6-9 TaxID=3415750 RepID=UPI003CC617A4